MVKDLDFHESMLALGFEAREIMPGVTEYHLSLKPKKPKVKSEHRHRWSGWPGAYCLYCGTEDANETALADGVEPPFLDKNGPCLAEPNRREMVDRLMNPKEINNG